MWQKVIAPYHNTLLACEFMIQRLQTKISETEIFFYLRLLSVKCQNWETFCSQFLRLTPSPSLSKHSPLPLEGRERRGDKRIPPGSHTPTHTPTHGHAHTHTHTHWCLHTNNINKIRWGTQLVGKLVITQLISSNFQCLLSWLLHKVICYQLWVQNNLLTLWLNAPLVTRVKVKKCEQTLLYTHAL